MYKHALAVMTLLIAIAAASCAPGERAGRAGAIPVAVLGDSDSHSYRDVLNGVRRGGANNARTFNWLEVWARLRPDQIDPGPFARAGDSRKAAVLKSFFGVPSRAPMKDDYLYDYAWSGARCASLNREWPEQTRWLAARLKSDPKRWAEGLVVIRIGVNDFGQSEHLTLMARDSDVMKGAIDACIEEIGTAVGEIRRVSTARIALVGISHDYDTPFAGPDVVPDAAVPGVAAALDRFDDGLKAIAEKDPRIAFVDDDTWLARRFGGRRADDQKPRVEIAGFVVRNAVGDAPEFLHTTDGHAGTIAAGLFLQHFIETLNARFGLSLSPPSDEEIVALARG